MVYMLTKQGYIDGQCGSIYTIHTDPMGTEPWPRSWLNLRNFASVTVNHHAGSDALGTSVLQQGVPFYGKVRGAHVINCQWPEFLYLHQLVYKLLESN